MISVFGYLDYQIYLKDFYEDKKHASPFFSFRLFGGKVGIDPSYLAKVILKSRHIADKSIPAVAAYCGLVDRENDYFETLVHFAKAKSQKQSRLYFEKLLSIKSPDSKQVVASQYEYYQKWYYSAVRSVLEYFPFSGSYKQLAEKLSPPITLKEAKEAVALLLKLEMISKDAEGIYRLTDKAVTTGSQWQSLAIQSFQEETIRMSLESLQRHPKALRDISTVTMNIDADDFTEIRERIREFRQALIKYVNESARPDRTYQFNIQLFPLSDTREAGK